MDTHPLSAQATTKPQATGGPGYRHHMRLAAFANIAGIALDRDAEVPLHRQIYEQIRAAILVGQLRSEVRLPSTRELARALGVSRNTVTRAFEQLVGEGYLSSVVGSGTRVTADLPIEMPELSTMRQATVLDVAGRPGLTPPRLSTSGRELVGLPYDSPRSYETFLNASALRAFRPGVPALDAFPFRLWERTLVSAWRSLSSDQLGYPSALGHLPLRESIAGHMRGSRGVRCEAEQVIITTGTQQSLAIITNVLLDVGDVAWVENPSFRGIHALLRAGQVDVVPLAVDNEGLVVDDGIRRAPAARLAYISPSHQYPLGVTMSLSRRLKLLEWAREADAWIVEDDYDSEFDPSGYPLQALQGLDTAGRVIYMGTFSKSMFPALRIGYVVAPLPIVEALRAAHAFLVRGVSLLSQVALDKFIVDGHFGRHVRRMRSVYAKRQQVLAGELHSGFRGLIELGSKHSGLHMIGWLPPGSDDTNISAALQHAGVDAPALSSLSSTPMERGGLVLGFSTPETELVEAARVMQRVIRENV